MTQLRISLFGRLQIESDGRPLSSGLDGRKVQELLSYLLLHRRQMHPRENLSDVLWGDNTGTQSRKYLRQALWQLKGALKSEEGVSDDCLLMVDAEWVGISDESSIWTDAGQFEETYASVQGKPGYDLNDAAVLSIATAVELYKGGLLQGWYQDWCIFERERFQNMYLAMLNKLMVFYESHRQYELGLVYGHRILGFDRAHERTHWRLMRLHYLSGDRTEALRQYDRCVTALDEELGVKPARWTSSLYEQIRDDQVDDLVASNYPLSSLSLVEQRTNLTPSVGVEKLQMLLVECRNELQRYMQLSGIPSGD